MSESSSFDFIPPVQSLRCPDHTNNTKTTAVTTTTVKCRQRLLGTSSSPGLIDATLGYSMCFPLIDAGRSLNRWLRATRQALVTDLVRHGAAKLNPAGLCTLIRSPGESKSKLAVSDHMWQPSASRNSHFPECRYCRTLDFSTRVAMHSRQFSPSP